MANENTQQNNDHAEHAVTTNSIGSTIGHAIGEVIGTIGNDVASLINSYGGHVAPSGVGQTTGGSVGTGFVSTPSNPGTNPNLGRGNTSSGHSGGGGGYTPTASNPNPALNSNPISAITTEVASTNPSTADLVKGIETIQGTSTLVNNIPQNASVVQVGYIPPITNQSKQVDVQTASKGLVSDLQGQGYTTDQINKALEVVKDKGSPTYDIKGAVDYINNQLYGNTAGEVHAGRDFTPEEIKAMKNLKIDSNLEPLIPIRAITKVANEILPSTKDFFGIDLTNLNPKDNSPVVIERIPTIGGKGTDVTNVRLKTFFEQNGIKDDAPAQTLKSTYEKIQSDYENGRITEAQAQALQDKALYKTYANSEMIRSIPQNVALGLGLVALNIIAPPIGTAVDVGFAGQALIQRNEILDMLEKSPTALGIQTASLIAGGLIGSSAVAINKALKAPKIEVDNLDSVTNLVGNDRTQAIKTAVNSADRSVQGTIKDSKLTANNVFKTITKDGREITIVTFSKYSTADLAKEGTLKGNDVIIGFEKLKGAENINRQFIGKSQVTATPEGSSSLIQGYTFKVEDGRIAKILQKIGYKDKPIGFSIAEESKVLESISPEDSRLKQTVIQSESRILKAESVSRDLARRIISINDKLEKGLNPTITEIKALINLELMANGEKPFTDAQWRQSNIGQLTKIQLKSILDRAEVQVKAIENEAGRLKSVRADIRENQIGIAQSKGIEIKEKVQEVIKPRKELTSVKEKGMTTSEFSKRVTSDFKSSNLFDRLESAAEKSTKEAPKEKLQTLKEFSKKIESEFANAKLDKKEPIPRVQRETIKTSEFAKNIARENMKSDIFTRLESAVERSTKPKEVSIEKGVSIKQFAKKVDVTFKNSGESDLKAPIESGQRGTTSLFQLKENIKNLNNEARTKTLANLKAKGTGALLAFAKTTKEFFSPIKVVKEAAPSLLASKSTFSEFPKIVQPNGKATSSFAGKGTYEKTNTTAFGNIKENSNKINNNFGGSKLSLGVKSSSLDIQTPKVDLGEKAKEDLYNKSNSNFAQRYNEAQKNAQPQMEQLRQQQEQRQQQRQNQTQGSFNRTTDKSIPKPKLKVPPIVPKLSNIGKGKEFKKDLKEKGFDVLVKEKGKFVRINSKPLATKEEALGVGFIKAKSDLSRSVIAVPTNRARALNSTLAQAEYNKFKGEFRGSKMYGEEVRVQKNALSSKSEVRQIQIARQVAPKKPIEHHKHYVKPELKSVSRPARISSFGVGHFTLTNETREYTKQETKKFENKLKAYPKQVVKAEKIFNKQIKKYEVKRSRGFPPIRSIP